jgi:hypothetical protein
MGILKFFLLIYIFTFAVNNLSAEQMDSSNSTKANAMEIPRNFIGISASSISSFGISYHHLYGNRTKFTDGFKITGILLPDPYDSNIWIFLGFEIQQIIYSNYWCRLYCLEGLSYQSLYIAYGGGLGYEVFTGIPGFAINLDFGISFLNPIDNPHGSGGSGIETIPGIGLGLSFAY